MWFSALNRPLGFLLAPVLSWRSGSRSPSAPSLLRNCCLLSPSALSNTNPLHMSSQSWFLRKTADSIGAKCIATNVISLPSMPNLTPTAPLLPISQTPTPTPAHSKDVIFGLSSFFTNTITAVIPRFLTKSASYTFSSSPRVSRVPLRRCSDRATTSGKSSLFLGHALKRCVPRCAGSTSCRAQLNVRR